MIPAKVNVLVVLFAYSGNGGIPGTIPELAIWLAHTVHKMKLDERIAKVGIISICDTPITMTRNRAVALAQKAGYDMVLMLDSDNEPDGYLNADPTAQPFWDVAFPFAYNRLTQGKPTIIAAPYCGPPPHPTKDDGGEVPYLFEWTTKESGNPHAAFQLKLMERNEAGKLAGIYPVAALPTGVSLFTVNVFEPLKKPYFDYTYDADFAEKTTTEDVMMTRNASLVWQEKIGENVTFAACDSWAFHHKVKKVGKPMLIGVEFVNDTYREAILANHSATDQKRSLDYKIPASVPAWKVLGPDDDTVTIPADAMARAQQQARLEGRPENPPEQKPEEIWIDEPAPTKFELSPSYDGPATSSKLINGYKVTVRDGEALSDTDLEVMQMAAEWLAQQRKAPLEAIVLPSGTGQSVAAILPSLPEGSHVFALDFYEQAERAPLKEAFTATFAKELEAAKVRIVDSEDIGEDTLLDIVLVERGADLTSLHNLIVHVKNGGLLMGAGFSDSADDIRNLADDFQLPLKTHVNSGVWCIPITPPAPPAKEAA